ncbi:MAG: sugar ABC transporter ATP-binding protein [Spirochaetaceae bacterium]
MTKRNSVLSVENITKRFLGTVALKDISLKLYEKEILAVMGENGAGKSTLMKILSGLYPASEVEGSIYLNDKKVSFNSPIDSENEGIAMIYQELNLELDLSVSENILLGRMPVNRMGLIDWNEAEIIATQALKRLNVELDMNVTVRNLSPSLQQLICIARALVRNPSILILDEPTSVLTATEADNLMDIIYGLRDEGISCIYISHKLDEVFKLCDRMVILRDGYYISEYIQSEVYNSELIIEDMIGRKLEIMYPTVEKTIGEEVFRVENLSVPHTSAYGKNIIEDVSFSLNKGEILGLCGLVGSGRSETINAIFGSIPKNSGKLFIEDREISITNTTDAKKHGIGLLTEDRKKNGFIHCMSICENMTITILDKIKRFLFINRNEEKRQAQVYFDLLRVKAPGLDTLISNLSGGNQQKVILSKWLLTDLKILMLDEPTRGIDVGTKSEIYRIINDLAKNGVSIIVISSEIAELIALCDRFVVLGKGTVQAEMNKEEASEVSILKASSGT